MPNISKIINSNGVSYNIKDSGASHYLGRLNSDNTPTTANITLVTGVTVTAKINDWIILQTKSDAFIWNGTEWTSFGGRGTDALVELVDSGAKNELKVTKDTIAALNSGTWNGNVFTPDGQTGLTLTINSDGSISTSGAPSAGVYIALSKSLDTILTVGETYILSGCVGGSAATYGIYSGTQGVWDNFDGGTEKVYDSSITSVYLYVRASASVSDKTFYPMICTKAAWDVSQKYVPYAMNNAELTQSVEPIPRLVDAGAKNVLNLNTAFTTHTYRGITYTNNHDGTILVDGTSTAGDSYATLYDRNINNLFGFHIGETVVIASTSDNVSINLIPKKAEGGYGATVYGYKSSPAVYTIPANFSGFMIRVAVPSSGTSVNNENVNGMICSFKDYNISPAFVPYAKSNRELTTLSAEDRASLVELVDGGAKNLLEVPTTTLTNNGVQFTINNGVITATILSETRADVAIFNITDSLNLKENEEYIFMVGLPSGASSSTYFYDVYDASWANRDVYSITRALESSRKRVRFIVAKEYTGAVGTTIIAKPMICSKVAWNISHAYQPYRPPYQEIYEQVETNKNNISKDEAALAELVDGGAKNLLKISATSQTISGVTFTVDSTNEIIINGTASSNIFYNIADNFELNAGSYIVNVPDRSTTSTYYIGLRDLDGGNYYLSSNNRTLTLEQKTQFSWIRIAIYSGYVFNNLLYEPMICTAEDYAISPKFVPYRPSYQELYERVVALEQANQ